MKRISPSYLFVGAMIVLLVVLGSLQYVWLGQVSDGERARLRTRVDADTRRFADDFNREIQISYFNFQLAPGVWESADRVEFRERYDFWLERSSYPKLIKSFTYANLEAGTFERFDPVSRLFVVGELSSSLEKLRPLLTRSGESRTVVDEVPALLMPVYPAQINRIRVRNSEPPPSLQFSPEMPEKLGFLIIELDPNTIRDALFADLRNKYFSEADGEYDLAIVNNSNEQVVGTKPLAAPDATVALMNLASEDFVFYANRNILPRVAGVKRNIVFSATTRHLETRRGEELKPISGGENSNSNVEVRVVTDNVSPAEIGEMKFPGEMFNPPWKLQVQHRSGSLDEFVAGTRRRNLAVGFGILGLLGASMMFIAVSTQRARSFAQKQVDFVSSVSHEFRTPLAVIYSASENLADGVTSGPDQVTRYGELIKNEGRKLSAMVEQILEFAGARSGKRRFDFRPSDAAEIVSDAISECGPLLKEKEFDVETWIEPELPTINADRVALSQAVQNLIVNAVKYSNGSKWVRIELQRWSEGVEISVIDRGIGIGKKDLRQIFEPFYRAGVVVDEQIHGNGLGLSLVKETVAAHGGKIDVESRVGEGSRFTIRIPV